MGRNRDDGYILAFWVGLEFGVYGQTLRVVHY